MLKPAFVIQSNKEACSEPCQAFAMELFAKIVDGLKLLTIFTNTSILNVWHVFEYVSE